MRHDLDNLRSDNTWTFAELTQKDTRYATHGYYTYPAKFIPQLAERLIDELTSEGEIVVDPFMGSGTTIVEALLKGRRAAGTDINPVAYLVSRVKSTPIEPAHLQPIYKSIERDLESESNGQHSLFSNGHTKIIPENERIDYWFPVSQKEKLGIILGRISDIKEQDCQEFFLVAFAQILKSCSIWLQKSVKPTRDPQKQLAEPLSAFLRQARFMQKRNHEFWNLVPPKIRKNLGDFRNISCADARTLPIDSGTAKLIVTSPPYVTSYEYADLHQLAALWLDYTSSLSEFRSRFIGSAHSDRSVVDLQSNRANEIIADLASEKKRREVRNYFADMLESFREMQRVLKPGGKACVVIGNTKFEGVEVRNAEVFTEQMSNLGFQTYAIIKRQIPSKILPQTRDPESGQFTSATNAQKVLAYPVEFIMIMERQ